MEEESTPKEQEEQQVVQKEPSMLDKLVEERQKIEAANKVMSDNLARAEKLRVADILGGDTQAGQPTVPKEKVMTDKEYAEAVLRGEIHLKK